MVEFIECTSLECYAAGFYKASAVMVGGAAESLILEVAASIKARLADLKRTSPKAMSDWRIKTVADSVYDFLHNHKKGLDAGLCERLEAHWPAFVQQLRATRNEAGHPTAIDPVTPAMVHASLLIFPELAHVARQLINWFHESAFDC